MAIPGRGMALIMVVMVIVALVIIATPFALSMRLQEQAGVYYAAEVEARLAARAGRALAIRYLQDTHPSVERIAGTTEDSDDGAGELTPAIQSVRGRTLLRFDDPRGTLVQVDVEDEQGKIDINDASPRVIANLLGATYLLAPLDERSTELQIADGSAFFTDGDPATLDGYLRIENEYVAYRHIVTTGAPGAPGLVQNIERGIYFTGPDVASLRHDAGTWVRDGRAFKIALHDLWARPGLETPFRSVNDIRSIADWDYMVVAIAELQRRGMTLARLEALGITERAIQDAGIDPAALGDGDEEGEGESRAEGPGAIGDRAALVYHHPACPQAGEIAGENRVWLESRDEAEAAGYRAADCCRERWENAGNPQERREQRRRDDRHEVTQAGLDPDDAEAVGGPRLVRRLAEAIRAGAFSPENIDALRQQLATEAEQAQQRQREQEEYEQGYYPAAFAALARMREEMHGLGTIGVVELEAMRPYITVSARRPAEWSPPEVVPHLLAPTTRDRYSNVRIPDARGYRRYATVRVWSAGTEPEYRVIVDRDGPDPYGWETVRLWPQLDGVYPDGVARISCHLPAPVDVNSAPETVLVALFQGFGTGSPVTTVGAVVPSGVTPAGARGLAQRFMNGTVDSYSSLAGLLSEAASASEIGGGLRLEILRSAVDGVDNLPITFASGDVYQITTRAYVNGLAGDVIARHEEREVVRVAPPAALQWHFDSQEDLWDRIAFADPYSAFQNGRLPDPQLPAVYAFRPDVRANLLASYPVNTEYGSFPVWPNTSHDPDDGFVRLATGEVAEDGARANTLEIEHWRDTIEGSDLAGAGSALSALPSIEDPHPFRTDPILAPGYIEMWLRPRTAGDFYLVDSGETASMNRLSLRYEGSDLILQAADEAMDEADAARMAIAPRCAELSAQVAIEPERWIHVAAGWRGARPHGDLALFVNGRSVGTERYVARLAADIGAGDLAIPIDPTNESFFDTARRDTRNGLTPVGVIQVGEEVIEYSGTSGNSFTVRPAGQTPDGRPIPLGRGARGSTARPHPRGTPVTVFGYQNPASQSIPVGGATLTRPWPGGGANGDQVPTAVVLLASGVPDPADLSGQRRIVIETTDTAIRTTSPDLVADGFPLDGGFIEISHDEGNVHELAYYQQVQGGVFAGVLRSLETKWMAQGPAPLGMPHRYAGYPGVDPDILIRLCSFHVSDPRGYRPGVDYQTGLADRASESWVQIAQRAGANAWNYEWLRYWRPPDATTNLPETVQYATLWEDEMLACGTPAEVLAGAGWCTATGWRNADGQDPSLQNPFAQILALAAARNFTISTLGANGGFHLGGDYGRGVKGTARLAHMAGERVIPVFRVCRPDSGPGDTVTLWDGLATNPVRVEMEVAWIYPFDPAADTWDRLAAFTDFVPRDYTVGGVDPQGTVIPGAPRLSKWPTGRGPMTVGAASLGIRTVPDRLGEPFPPMPYDGLVDELRLDQDPANRQGFPDIMPPVDFAIPPNPTPQDLQRLAQVMGAGAIRTILGRIQSLLQSGSGGGGFDDYAEGLRLVFTLLPRATTDSVGPLGGAVPPTILGRSITATDGVLSASDLRQASLTAVGQTVPDVFGSWKQFLIDVGDERRLIRIDDEVIGIGADQGGTSVGIVRGVLGTQPASHPQESPIYILPYPPASIVTEVGDRYANLEAGAGFPAVGYLGIDRGGGNFIREMLPYRQREGNTFVRPVDERNQGTFRSSFGTDRVDVMVGDLAIAQPFRHFDRYQPGTASPDAVFLDLTANREDALWRAIHWEADFVTGDQQIVCLVRFDGRPDWNAQPTSQPGGLFRFDDPTDDNLLDVEADLVEVRFFFPFRAGSFSRGTYTSSPALKSVTLDFLEPARTLQHDRLVP